jgi:hypothetical protein
VTLSIEIEVGVSGATVTVTCVDLVGSPTDVTVIVAVPVETPVTTQPGDVTVATFVLLDTQVTPALMSGVEPLTAGVIVCVPCGVIVNVCGEAVTTTV